MRPIARRILLNAVFANAENESRRHGNLRGDPTFTNKDTFEKPDDVVSVGAETVAARNPNHAAPLIGDDAQEIDDWRDVGGEA